MSGLQRHLGGLSGGGKISLLGSITREIIWSQRKCKLEKEERGSGPGEKVWPVQGHFWNQREELESALESPALCARVTEDRGRNEFRRGDTRHCGPYAAGGLPLRSRNSEASDCPTPEGVRLRGVLPWPWMASTTGRPQFGSLRLPLATLK